MRCAGLVFSFFVCPASAQQPSVSTVVDLINARLSQYVLVKVALPAIVDKKVVAIYEIKRVKDQPVPIVLFKPREYIFNYNLTQDPTKYVVDDFCKAIHYSESPGQLKLVDVAARLGNDREGEITRLAREGGVVEIALAAYAAGVYFFEAHYNAQISLLGTAEDDPREPPNGLYSTPPAHHSFGVLSKEGTVPYWYREIERYFNFNGSYFYRDIPNLRSEEFRKKIMVPIASICGKGAANVRILDGVMLSGDKFPDSVRIFIHVW